MPPDEGACNSAPVPGKIGAVHLLGAPGQINFTRDANGLALFRPDKKPCDIAFALQIK